MTELFMRGGPLMYFLLLLSVTSLSLIFERIFFFVYTRENYEQLLASVKKAIVEKKKCAVNGRGVAAYALRSLLDNDDIAAGEEHAFVEASKRVLDLEKRLSIIKITAHIAPLIGLLGTILGMIETFSAMERFGSEGGFDILAGGIWSAMLTTAFGLIVAIPNVVASDIFNRIIDERSKMAELLVVEVVKEINVTRN